MPNLWLPVEVLLMILRHIPDMLSLYTFICAVPGASRVFEMESVKLLNPLIDKTLHEEFRVYARWIAVVGSLHTKPSGPYSSSLSSNVNNDNKNNPTTTTTRTSSKTAETAKPITATTTPNKSGSGDNFSNRLEHFLGEYRQRHCHLPAAAAAAAAANSHHHHKGPRGRGPALWELPKTLIGTTGPRQVLVAASRVRLLEPAVLDAMWNRATSAELEQPKDAKHKLLDKRPYAVRARPNTKHAGSPCFEPFCDSVKVIKRDNHGHPRQQQQQQQQRVSNWDERYRVQRALWRIFADCEMVGAFADDEFRDFAPSIKKAFGKDGYVCDDPVAMYPRDRCLWVSILNKHMPAEETKIATSCGWHSCYLCDSLHHVGIAPRQWQMMPGGEYDCVLYSLFDMFGCSPVTFFFLTHACLGKQMSHVRRAKPINRIAVNYGQPMLALDAPKAIIWDAIRTDCKRPNLGLVFAMLHFFRHGIALPILPRDFRAVSCLGLAIWDVHQLGLLKLFSSVPKNNPDNIVVFDDDGIIVPAHALDFTRYIWRSMILYELNRIEQGKDMNKALADVILSEECHLLLRAWRDNNNKNNNLDTTNNKTLNLKRRPSFRYYTSPGPSKFCVCTAAMLSETLHPCSDGRGKILRAAPNSCPECTCYKAAIKDIEYCNVAIKLFGERSNYGGESRSGYGEESRSDYSEES